MPNCTVFITTTTSSNGLNSADFSVLSHLTKMRVDYLGRKVFLACPYETRRRGIPRLRWGDGVQENTEKFDIPNWRKQVLKRDE